MVEDIFRHRVLLQHCLIVGMAIYAWLRGDAPEKVATAVLPCMVLLLYLYEATFAQSARYDRVNLGYFAIDGLGLVVFGYLALKANRMYPLWLLGAQLISVMMHLVRDLSEAMHPVVYFILTTAPSWVQIMALAIGLYCHRKRIARYGSYRSWRTS